MPVAGARSISHFQGAPTTPWATMVTFSDDLAIQLSNKTVIIRFDAEFGIEARFGPSTLQVVAEGIQIGCSVKFAIGRGSIDLLA